jgi:hypothetical protein
MNRGEILKLTVARRKWAEQPYGDPAMLRSIVLAKPFVGGRDIRDFASGGFQLGLQQSHPIVFQLGEAFHQMTRAVSLMPVNSNEAGLKGQFPHVTRPELQRVHLLKG